jgi:hypothetical protein
MTVIKIEEDEDTGGLDMYVDIPDDIKHPVNISGQDDLGEPSEIEDPPGEWSREDFSNESGSLGAIQMCPGKTVPLAKVGLLFFTRGQE